MTTPTRTTRLDQARALQRWVRSGEPDDLAGSGFVYDKPTGEVVFSRQRNLGTTGRQSRAMSDQLQTGGGYSVAETFADQLDFQLKFFAAVRQYATIVTTPRGGAFVYPVVEDFANEGIEIPENSLMSENDIEQFGQAKLYPHKIGSQWLLIPTELFEDAPLAFADWLARLVGERCGRGANRRYTQTLTAQAPVGATTASATAIAGDEIISLFYGVDAAYRDAPAAGWLMHSDMIQYIRELKDTAGRYLFRRSRVPGAPDTIFGKPVVPNYAMSSTPTAATTSMFFGDLSRVLIRDVGDIRIKQAVERWADIDLVGVVGFLRTSAAILDIGGAPIQALVQHS